MATNVTLEVQWTCASALLPPKQKTKTDSSSLKCLLLSLISSRLSPNTDHIPEIWQTLCAARRILYNPFRNRPKQTAPYTKIAWAGIEIRLHGYVGNCISFFVLFSDPIGRAFAPTIHEQEASMLSSRLSRQGRRTRFYSTSHLYLPIIQYSNIKSLDQAHHRQDGLLISKNCTFRTTQSLRNSFERKRRSSPVAGIMSS